MVVRKKLGRATLASGSMGTPAVKAMKKRQHRSHPGAGAEHG